ncbi:MAG: hypothetical protein QOF43_906, partial [Gaiellaceae bacterium]|nr:hypothetical protein [Gaiellaceae bacterium]
IGFDNSWQIGLHLAAVDGLDYGRDVVFPYGPLGFLGHPLIVSWWTGAASFVYAVVAQVVLGAVVFTAASRVYGRLCGAVLAFVVLSLTLLLSDITVYLAFFFAVWLLEREVPPRVKWLVPLCAVFAAAELLVKLNSGALCVVLFLLAVWRLPPRGLRAELLFVASFVLTLPLLWLVSGNALSALPAWLRESTHIVFGYTGATAVDGSGRGEGRVFAVSLIAGAAALLVPRLRSLPRSRWIPLLLVVATYGFAYLKEGFVREDEHVLYFFAAVAVGALAFAWKGVARIGAAALVVGAAAAAVASPDATFRSLYRPVAHLRTAVLEARAAVDPGARRRDVAEGRADARSQLAVPAHDLSLLRGHSVDVEPYEISTAWAYELHWRPEPLLQWYTALDSHLDRLNASALASRGADRVLRQRTPTLDAKVASFESPATFLTLVCRYREVAADGSWEVLARTPNRCDPPRPIGSAVGREGATIAVVRAPSAEDIVYARIRFPRLSMYRVESVLLKPARVPRMVLGGSFRFVPETADSPLVLRMPESAGLSPLFGGFAAYEWFRLEHVPSPFSVDFFAVRIHGRFARRLSPQPPDGGLDGSEVVVGKRRFRISKGVFQGWVDAAAPAGETAVLAGWAIDPGRRQSAPRVAAFVGERLVAVTKPAESRPDVAQGLQVPTLGTSGYSFVLALPPHGAHVRVFALGRGVATELTYPGGYPWR